MTDKMKSKILVGVSGVVVAAIIVATSIAATHFGITTAEISTAVFAVAGGLYAAYSRWKDTPTSDRNQYFEVLKGIVEEHGKEALEECIDSYEKFQGNPADDEELPQ